MAAMTDIRWHIPAVNDLLICAGIRIGHAKIGRFDGFDKPRQPRMGNVCFASEPAEINITEGIAPIYRSDLAVVHGTQPHVP